MVVGCWLLVVSCWWLMVGCWLLVVSCWWLMVGCWLFFNMTYSSHSSYSPHHPITPSPLLPSSLLRSL
ncbi:hypothetical protein CA946_09740 [Fischerella thermalis 111/344/542]|nr:hypothetical protein CA946_09740 [Fischerella thermalis 111/344/542]